MFLSHSERRPNQRRQVKWLDARILRVSQHTQPYRSRNGINVRARTHPRGPADLRHLRPPHQPCQMGAAVSLSRSQRDQHRLFPSRGTLRRGARRLLSSYLCKKDVKLRFTRPTQSRARTAPRRMRTNGSWLLLRSALTRTRTGWSYHLLTATNTVGFLTFLFQGTKYKTWNLKKTGSLECTKSRFTVYCSRLALTIMLWQTI